MLWECTRAVVGVLALAILIAGCGGGGGGGGGTTPTVTVLAPAEDLEIGLANGGVIRVTYSDDYANGVATTDLLADQDGDPDTRSDQVAIARGRSDRDGAPQTVDWDVTGAPPGAYRILAVTTAPSGKAVGAAPGRAQLNAGPTLAFLSPSTNEEVLLATKVEIRYRTDDADDAALCMLWVDRDGDPDTVDDSWDLTRWFPDGDGSTETHVWDTLGLAPATYTIFGMIWDGTNPPVVVESPGTITLIPSAWQAGGYTDDYALGIDTWPDGSCVVVGYFSGESTFGAGEPNETLLDSAGDFDAFVARYDASGALTWATRAGGGSFDQATDVAVLPDGSSLVIGICSADATFGSGETNEITHTAEDQDAFVAKYGSDGSLAWVRFAGGTSEVYAYVFPQGIALGPNGSFALTGYYYSTAVFGPGETRQRTLSAAGSSPDVFVAEYASDGSLTWAEGAGSSSHDHGYAITHNGTYWYVTGDFMETARFGPGTFATVTSRGGSDAFVALYTSTGYVTYATRGGGEGSDSGRAIAADPNDGSILVAGRFSDRAAFRRYASSSTSLSWVNAEEHSTDVFLAKYYALSLTLSWLKDVGGAGSDYSRGIAVYPDGSFVVTGTYRGGATFGSGAQGELPSGPYGPYDDQGFVARYSSSGGLSWVKAALGASVHPSAVAVASDDGSCRVTGYFQADLTVLPDEVGETTLLSREGPLGWAPSLDVFVARHASDGGAE